MLPGLPIPLPEALNPLVAALYARPAPRSLAVTVRAFAFPRPAGGARIWLTAQVPLGDLVTRPIPAALARKQPSLQGRQLVRFMLLAAIEDSTGHIVADAGQRFGFAVAASRLARAAAPPWSSQFILPPGAYTARTVLYQSQGQKTTVESRPLAIASAAPVRVGSIAIVRDVQDALQAPHSADPWRYQNAEIIPNLTGVPPASRDPKRTVGFYFLAQVPPGTTGASVRMQFRHRGRVFERTPPFPLPPPDSQGRIRFLANIPLRLFPPGVYSATVIVQAAGRAAASAVSFRTVSS